MTDPKSEEAIRILETRSYSTNFKLHEMFQLHKTGIKNVFPSLYYVLLEWEEENREQLIQETVEEYGPKNIVPVNDDIEVKKRL